MTDRELLEWAAKAAGVSFFDIDDQGVIEFGAPTSSGFRHWNPLTDDGDALRLAVKCDIDLEFQCPGVEAHQSFNNPSYDGKGRNVFAEFDGDPYAATRRAIVRAAAEIGKGMV